MVNIIFTRDQVEDAVVNYVHGGYGPPGTKGSVLDFYCGFLEYLGLKVVNDTE